MSNDQIEQLKSITKIYFEVVEFVTSAKNPEIKLRKVDRRNYPKEFQRSKFDTIDQAELDAMLIGNFDNDLYPLTIIKTFR